MALLATVLTVAGIGLLFLLPYPLKDFRYPVGWDAAFYVWRAKAVTVDGLARIGTIRAATPLLLATLMRATGQNAFTMVALVPVIMAGVVALAAGAMARAALGIRAMWVPVVGALAWVAFGRIGMMNGHLDTVINTAFIVSGFAAAVAFAGNGRGAVAVAVLFMAAALAEWPFYAFAMAVFLLGLTLFSLPWLRSRRAGRREPLGPAGPLLVATGVSAVFTGLTFLSVPPVGGVGLNIGRASIRRLLKERFLSRVRDTLRYWAFPLAALGAWAAVRTPAPPARLSARRLFLSLMAAWTVGSVLAGVAQLAGVPVAGARLLYSFFPVPILAGVFVWWLARYLAERFGPALGRTAAALAVAGALLGFGLVAWNTGLDRAPYMETKAVQETAAAGLYVARYVPDRQLVYILNITGRRDASTLGRWWHVVRAVMPADQVARVHRYIGSPLDYLAGRPSNGATDNTSIRQLQALHPVAIVVERYNQHGFVPADQANPGHLVSPGVLAFDGPVPPRPLPAPAGPRASTQARNLVWLAPLVLLILLVAGGGWSLALLPPDPVVRTTLAPGLGAAAIALVALAWDRVGLGFGPVAGIGPLVLSTAAGYVLAVLLVVRNRRAGPG